MTWEGRASAGHQEERPPPSPVSPDTRARRQQRTERATSQGVRRHTEWECSRCWKTNWKTTRECRGCMKVREGPSFDRVVLGWDATWVDEQDAREHTGHRGSAPAGRQRRRPRSRQQQPQPAATAQR